MAIRPTDILRPLDIGRATATVTRPIRPPRVPQLREANPLALLPLRLEYRFVTATRPVEVIDREIVAATRARAAAGRSGTTAPRNEPLVARGGRAPAVAAPVRSLALPQGSEQLWVRWYPDDNFAETGVAPPNDTERAALVALNAGLGGTPWWRASENAAAASAWQGFVEIVGAVRAVHLKRTEHAPPSPDPALRAGRIAGLPATVHLFALTNGAVTPIGAGKTIPANAAAEPSVVRYTPQALQQDGWLVNFSRAVECGMGVKITDKAMVEAAKKADWIIAVGISGSEGPAEIAALLTDRIASGGFAVLAQDTQTNATAGGTTGYNKAKTRPLDYLRDATEDEQGRHDTPKLTAAELLAEAFGIDEKLLRKAVGAADQGFEDARAMLRVVGPILLDGLLDGKTFSFNRIFPDAGPEVDENTFIDILAGCISARGVLPALRFGNSAYGVLPMTRVAGLNVATEADLTSDERQVLGTLATVANQARMFLPLHAQNVVPVLKPDDPAASDTLSRILRLNPVSKRVDVADHDAPDTAAKAIGCPYVQANRPQQGQAAASYLEALARNPIASLPDPTEEDRGWPLLYRLARLSLSRNLNDIVRAEMGLPRGSVVEAVRVPPAQQARNAALAQDLQSRPLRGLAAAPTPGISPSVLFRLQRASAAFAAALDHLRGIAGRDGGIAQLEMLLFETIDLFQYRLDAIGVGLAYSRLARSRRKGRKGMDIGYYGMIGKLRPASSNPAGDGYIQAPSQAQALTAAVLRSAYRRHRAEGAFAIDLSGPQVRRALRLLDLLSKGHSLAEGLGMLGERWLHEQRQDALIFPLRTEFPIAGERGEAAAGRRVFDGYAFATAAAAVTGVRASLRTMLVEELDTIADLVMAEAAHLRAQGLAGAANAWLQVLSGGPIPGMPSFVRTQRSGHGSTHRLCLALPAVEPDPAAGLRARLEPGLAALATTLLTKFDTAAIELRAARAATGASARPVRLLLARDLGMAPIDLVVGGLAEVERRAKAALIEALLADPALAQVIAAAAGAETFAGGEAGFTADLSVGPVPVEGLAATAERLRSIVARGRPLEPADFNAAAPATAGLLDEAGEIAAVEHAIAALKRRADAALALLAVQVAPVPAQLTGYLADTLELARREAAGMDAASIASQRSLAETRRRALSASLRALIPYGVPEALEPVVIEEDVADGEATRARVTGLLAVLEQRRAALAAAAGVAATGRTTAGAARADLAALVGALQGLAGGAAMPVLPPVPRATPALQPILSAAASPATALGPWGAVRERIGQAAALAGGWSKAMVFPVAPAATAEDPATPAGARDPQPESVSPRSWHFGQFLGEPAVLGGTAPIAGAVVDEWAEQRPSAVQPAAIAVNYDTPQNEAPNAILLAVPPDAQQVFWTPELAAQMVGETIAWMQVRAIPADLRAATWTVLPNANRVPLRPGRPAKRRIPLRTLNLSFAGLERQQGLFVVSPKLDAAARAVAEAAIAERDFGSKLKE
jgi:hypothetical protein